MFSQESRSTTSTYEQATFEIALEGVTGEVGAADQGEPAVDDEDLGVH